MQQNTFIYLFLIIGLLSCKHNSNSLAEKEYVMQAFDSIAKYSLYKNTFNFDSLKEEVLIRISDSNSRAEVYDKLEDALRVIDKHSYIIRKEKWKLMKEGKNPSVLMNPYPFNGKILNEKYAYVSMDGFLGGDSLAADNYVDSLQRLTSFLYGKDPKGWIIDLRYNSGGWSPAMFAGLGPILGRGVKAYTVFAKATPIEHYYAKSDDNYLLISDSVWTFDETLPTAVLIGEGTGSAGELLALAFRGNSKTKLIGEPTYGVSTDLTPIFMPDSFQLIIASSVMTDRNKNGDGGQIVPDILCNDPMDTFEKAYEWIDNN